MDHLFVNEQIDISNLPQADEVTWVPLNKKYLPISLLSTALFGLLLLSIFLVVNFVNTDMIEDNRIVFSVIGGVILLFVFILLISALGFKHKAYALREHDVLYKSGLIFRKTIALPFNRVQHSEINQGPIERKFNLASLEIFTAGGSQSDLTIPGLLNEDAQSMKAFIMEKASKHE